ncbi:HdeD family acid-resistance protein [Agathobacter sp.]
MREFLNRIKADFLLSSVLCIALGVVFIVWRASVLEVVANILAVLLIIIGAMYVCSYFLKIVTNGLSVMMGIVVLAVGIWFLIQPRVVVELIPIVIGLVLVFHSIRSIVEAVDAKKYGYNAWGVGLVLSVISLVCGILCVTNAFNIMKTATVIVGLILIFNGVSNIWITSRATKAETAYNKQQEFESKFVEDRDENS